MTFNFKPATSTPQFSFPSASTAAPTFGQAQPASTAASFAFSAPAPAAGGFSFGAPTSAVPPAASTSGGFSFGAPAPSSTSSSPFPGFGATAPAAPSTSTFGNSFTGFGAPANTASNLFGASQQQPAPANPFGASQPAPAAPFGASTASQPPAAPGEPSIQDKLAAIYNAWNPQSPACRFQSFFYNVVEPPNQVAQYGKPQLANDAAWQRARRENPDPDKMVPALAMGFDDIKRRVEAQDQRAKAHYARLSELTAEIRKRTTNQVEPSSTRLQRASLNQTKLAARLMAVIAQLHPLTTHRGAALRGDEEALFNKIAAAHAEFASGPTRLPAMLNELWVQVASRRAAVAAQTGDKEGREWEVANEEELGRILEVVDQQQRGLAFLTKTLQGDLADINVIRAGWGLPRV